MIAENGKKLADQFKKKVKLGKEKMEEQLVKVNGKVEDLV